MPPTYNTVDVQNLTGKCISFEVYCALLALMQIQLVTASHNETMRMHVCTFSNLTNPQLSLSR